MFSLPHQNAESKLLNLAIQKYEMKASEHIQKLLIFDYTNYR